MRLLIIFFLVCLLVACQKTTETTYTNTTPKDTIQPDDTTDSPFITDANNGQPIRDDDEERGSDFCDSLGQYFRKNVIDPVIDRNFNDENESITTFKIGKHTVEWSYDDTATYAKIDHVSLDLHHAHTIPVEGNVGEVLLGAYFVSGIKLYATHGKEIMGIEFGEVGCGKNCLRTFSVFYDFSHKTTNYFSATAMDCFTLYDFNHDQTIDFLTPTFEGDQNGIKPFTEQYTLLRLDANGEFGFVKDLSGKKYFVKIAYTGREPEMRCAKSKMNWFEKIE